MEEDKEEQATGNVKVLCRFRPLNEKESQTGEVLNLNISDDQKTLSLISSMESTEPFKFTFDYIFHSNTRQQDVYEISARPIVEAVMQGFNGTVFAYGQTSSGKTYTMTGPDLEDIETKGVIPRMVSTVFETIVTSDPFIEYAVKVSYCEIYLEKIKDLLDTTKTNLKIHEDKTRGVFIDELTERYVADDGGVYEIMKTGLDNRNVGSTNMNSVSSRSHSIFLITIMQTNNRDYIAKTGKLYLVDLAGSEKVGKTGAAGKRLEEAKNINKSLTMLGLVIYSLTDGKSTHIPYRDSKLTRILQDSLGGNSKTALIITCSPSPYNEAETISTLRFGMRAKSIKNTPKINREYTVAELKLMVAKCKEEIAKKDRRIKQLEDLLKTLGGKIPLINDAKVSNEEDPETPVEPEQATIKIEDYDETIAELEEARTKLAQEVDYSKKLKLELMEKLEGINGQKSRVYAMTQEVKALKDRLEVSDPSAKEKDNYIEVLTVTKDSLESERIVLNAKIIELELKIAEKEAEVSTISKKFSQGRPKSAMNDFKDLLKSEREINAGYQKEIQLLRQNVGDLLNKKCPEAKIQEIFKDEFARKEKDKWIEERKKIIADLQNRIDRIAELEILLDDAKDSCRAIENSMSDGERALKKRTDNLERNLEQLTLMYHKLISQKSQLGVDRTLVDKKLARVMDRGKGLEEENKRLSERYEQAEAKLSQFQEENASASNRNSKSLVGGAHIKKTIMGGASSSKRNSIKTPFDE